MPRPTPCSFWAAAQIVVGALLCVAGPRARAQGLPASDQRYEIEASLDTLRHELSARERIHFVNHARRPLPALYFHLYLNAFRDEHSVFMREGGQRLRGGALRHPGRIEIQALRTADGVDLLPAAERELEPRDFTQLRAPLPKPLPQGAALDLELAFRAKLPQIVARAGFAREFHMLGQWFPKLARLEDNGEFVSFPYHGLGEFYSDFADYDFAITLPAAYQIAASGVRVGSSSHAGLRTDRFVARHVHDVAWAAYPYFIVRDEQVGSVHVKLFAPRGYQSALERQARVIRAALPYFERRYGAYPYQQLTIVLPTAFAQRAAGMEYPTLFVSAGRFWALPAWAPDPAHDVICVHELAHQWFSGMIASDEVAHPALDEGLAEWAALDFLRNFYRTAPSFFATHRPPFELFDVVRALYLFRSGPALSSLLPASSYRYETLARAVYMQPAVSLEAIAERFGRNKLEAALSRYARAQRFRHPTPAALFQAFDATFGAGFAQRVLEPALSGKPAAPARAVAQPTGLTFSAELLFAAQALLQWLGA